MTDVLEYDGANKIHLIQLEISLEAIDDKIIVLIDAYRNPYDCKNCNATGEVDIYCSCVGNGFAPGTRNKFGAPCEQCGGDPTTQYKHIQCPVCKGHKAIIEIPENYRSLPTTGEIISRGPSCKLDSSQIGGHVIFSPHVGTMIPLKGNIRLKVMREHEPLVAIFSDKPQNNFMQIMDDVRFEDA